MSCTTGSSILLPKATVVSRSGNGGGVGVLAAPSPHPPTHHTPHFPAPWMILWYQNAVTPFFIFNVLGGLKPSRMCTQEANLPTAPHTESRSSAFVTWEVVLSQPEILFQFLCKCTLLAFPMRFILDVFLMLVERQWSLYHSSRGESAPKSKVPGT